MTPLLWNNLYCHHTTMYHITEHRKTYRTTAIFTVHRDKTNTKAVTALRMFGWCSDGKKRFESVGAARNAPVPSEGGSRLSRWWTG